MKKIFNHILILLFLLVTAKVFAASVGTVNAIWSSPAAFKPDQQVTFYFDVTGTTLVGHTDLHLYSWTPKEIEPWGNPSANTLLTPTANPAVFTLTCTPTTLWGTTAANFGLSIEGLIKTEDGTSQTEDFKEANGNAFKLFNYTLLNSNIAVVWPPEFTKDKPISVVVNLATAWANAGASQGQLVGESVYIWLGANSWNPGSQYNALGNLNARCDLVANETNVAQYNFWPDSVFPPAAPTIKELDFLFNNGTWDKTGRDVAGGDFKVKPLTNAPGSAAFTPFPKKTTQGDIINLIYKPLIDTLGTGISQGILTGSDRIFVYMEFETASGNVIPVDKAVVTTTDKLKMLTFPDGHYEYSFILNDLFTPTELPTGLEVTKIKITFLNFDGFTNLVGSVTPFVIALVKSDK
ncbi:MAG: hypothetical protein WCO63_03590 [Bacteroidota bacterium]